MPHRTALSEMMSKCGHLPRRFSGPITNKHHRCYCNLVEEFVSCLADALQPLDLSQSEIRIGDEPAFCRDLVLNEVILRSGVANPRPAFPGRVHEVQIVWNQRDEVVDIGVPIAVEGSGEEQSRIVVEEYEPHVVEGADLGRTG